MRTLTLTAAGIAASMLLAFSAQAATLQMSTDKLTYNISETITLTVTGDATAAGAGGTADNNVFGTIAYGGLVTGGGGQTQNQLTSLTVIPWIVGALLLDVPQVGTQDSFNQLNGAGAFLPDVLLTAVMTFHADAAGVANFDWVVGGGTGLDFFGLSSALGHSVTIIPEPTTAALLGIGLFGLAVAGRRR